MNKKNISMLVSLIFVSGIIASTVAPISASAEINPEVNISMYYSGVPDRTPRGLRAGTEKVNGISKIKKQIYAAGGDDIAVAVAMLESKTMDSPDNSKSGDAANYTRFNMNWYAIRIKLYHSLGPNDAYKVKNNFTGSIAKETKTFMKYKSAWGKDFYKIQRGGQSGLNGGYVKEIADYQDAITFIAKQLSNNPQFKTDNTRVWVDVPYI